MSTRLLALAAVLVASAAQHLPLPELPYAYEALEPHMEAATLRVHHMGHFASYTSKLNDELAVLRGDPELKAFAKMGVDELLLHLEELPEPHRTKIANNGGGFINHELFFSSMSPSGGGSPTAGGPLATRLEQTFGGVEAFKAQMKAAALGVFGSGWAFLVYDENSDELRVVTTANQESPMNHRGLISLVALDVWEHAYYLEHMNRRGDFVEAFLEHLVNWTAAEEHFEAAVARVGATSGEL